MPIPDAPRTFHLTAWRAAAIYAAAAVVWTWPLATRLSSSIAWDLGDPMFIAWVMGWVNDSVIALAHGDAARFALLWHPPVFHPEPFVLAYSEHMVPQALSVLPIYAATGNAVLAYNIAVLATIVLSGTGMFLLGRELTGSAAAGLLAGAIYAFAPYRVDQMSHLPVLSSQWMPLALYGLRRYFETRARRPLVWASLALVLNGLSTGYFLFYFLPFVLLYVLTEMAARRRLADSRAWRELALAGVSCALVTLPFLIPYLSLRATGDNTRPYAEIVYYSADVYAYLTGSAYIAWWRDTLDVMRAAPENAAFPGVTATAFAGALLVMLVLAAVRRWRDGASDGRGRDRAARAALVIGVAALAACSWILLTGGGIVDILVIPVRVRSLWRPALYAAAAIAAAASVSPRLRGALKGQPGSLAAASLVFAGVAFVLSLGPEMHSMKEAVGYGPYALLLKIVPGFDALRVPSRYAMIVMLWLAVAAAYAAAALARQRLGVVAVLVCAVFAVAESRPSRFLIDEPATAAGTAPVTSPSQIARALSVYEAMAGMPKGILLELPFGAVGWDIQYMHAQSRHGWPLINGYSGHYPPGFARTVMVRDALTSPDVAWRALGTSGATHALVHEWAFSSLRRGKRTSKWLLDSGAQLVLRSGDDALYRLPFDNR
jgi:hypothetical protein